MVFKSFELFFSAFQQIYIKNQKLDYLWFKSWYFGHNQSNFEGFNFLKVILRCLIKFSFRFTNISIIFIEIYLVIFIRKSFI